MVEGESLGYSRNPQVDPFLISPSPRFCWLNTNYEIHLVMGQN